MDRIEQAIFTTLAYADIFEYPLTAAEIHKYLIGWKCDSRDVDQALEQKHLTLVGISKTGKYYTLPGHENNVATRQQREEISSRLWPKTKRYSRVISAMPFIKMVAVTGSLAVNNAESGADIDTLIVTQKGRIWTTRAMVILLTRLAAQLGDKICPNYFISEDHLVFSDQTLFTAHEVLQMIPLAGLLMYQKLIELNSWTFNFLPNAQPQFATIQPERFHYQAAKRSLEVLLNFPLASKVETWEMNRKVRRFSEEAIGHPEACYRADLCKGHVDDHGKMIQKAFKERLMVFEEITV